MKRKICLIVLSLLSFVLVLTGCRQKLTDTPLENMVTVADFSKGENDSFFSSNGWCNGEPFNVTWSKKNVKYEDGVAKLFITENEDPLATVPYYGGEIRSKDHYHYGDYEITMKVDPTKGTCTSFFVYTGPSEMDENGNPNPHDEVDIEFLGKDTTHVQFNFFVNGEGGNEYMYDLGFDASEEFHRYGFRWTESYITWYVDGVPVYRVDETAKKPLPKTPGRMMTNYWCGTEKAELWMGKYKKPEGFCASEYKNISTSATPIVDPNSGNEDINIDWTKIDAISGLTGESSDAKHTVTNDGSTYKVVYSDVQGGSYNNVKFNLDDQAKGMNYLYLNLTNNTQDKFSTVRIDVFGNATRKTTNNQNVCNVSATMDGEEAPTDLSWGGSTFAEIEPGKTVEIIIYFEGVASDLQFMFDSSTYQDTKVYSGDITISNLKFGVYGELKLPEDYMDEPTQQPTEPNLPTEEPVAGEISINGVNKVFEGNTDTYSVSYIDNTLDIKYSNVKGDCYHNINTKVNDIASNKNVFTVKITNNGSVTVKVRIDINSLTKVNETIASNVSATLDGVEVYTDTTWGGSVFEIKANSTSVCVVEFDSTRTTDSLMFYFDSATYQDSALHTGNIILSELAFSGEVNQPTQPVEPDNSEVKYLEFTTDGSYTVKNNETEKSTTVSYTNIMDSSYKCISTNFAQIVGNNNVISLSLTNNGTESVSFRLDVGYDNNGALVSKIISCTGAQFNDYDATANVVVAAGATVEVRIVFDVTTPATGMNIFVDSGVWMEEANRQNHSGNVTISNIKFSQQ